MTKVYLGDSVYAEFDGYCVTLTTENGFGPNNTIVMEPYVTLALLEFIESVTAEDNNAHQNTPR